MKIENILIILLFKINFIFSWPNHDIQSLKLLHVIHRHGERTPIQFSPNDPFSDLDKYWMGGNGELTPQGKYRMYQVGKFIGKEYASYLGEKLSPKDIYVRSSSLNRTLESASALLAGLYPPGKIRVICVINS